jgi:hypothetical protein
VDLGGDGLDAGNTAAIYDYPTVGRILGQSGVDNSLNGFPFLPGVVFLDTISNVGPSGPIADNNGLLDVYGFDKRGLLA